GDGERIRKLRKEYDGAPRHRDSRDLHRVGYSVRKLRASADDPFGLAFGDFWRAPDALPVPDGSEHLRFRRLDHADRYREEERNHADRLRARGRTPRGQGAARSDL